MDLALSDSRVIYLFVILAVGLQRLTEVVVSAVHARRLLRRGGVERGRGHLPWMIALHTAFLIACPVEVFALDRPFVPLLAAAMVLATAIAQVIRYWAIQTLGDRWSVRVIAVPGEPLVSGGPYRRMRHPNYLAVIVEIVAIPLIHTAWLTALVFSALNVVLLRVRILCEEKLLRDVAADGAALDVAGRFGPRV